MSRTKRVSAQFGLLSSVMNSIGSLWIFALMFLICTDVIARGVFNSPIRGVTEMVGYSLIGAVYLQLTHSLHVGRFTRAEMFIEPLMARRPVVGAIFKALFDLAGIVVFAIIANGAWSKLVEAWPDLTFGAEGEFTVLVWPLRFIILLGSTMVALEYFSSMISNLSTAFQRFHERRESGRNRPVGWLYLLIPVALVIAVILLGNGDLSRAQVGMFALIGMLVVILLGVHIGVGLILVGFLGIWIMLGNQNVALSTVKLASNEFLRNFTFGAIPLFVLMGLLVNASDIGKETFDVASWATKRIKGGLGVATVVANAVFAAITGSSIASAAVFTKVAVPHMQRHGYSTRFAVGTVAGSSVLGMLIPPSLLLIIYAFVAEQSIGHLFLAAVVPGLLMATAMIGSIIAIAHFWPDYVGRPDNKDEAQESIRSAAVKVSPIILLVAAVMGGIYGGLFTPVEAGAVGAAGALLIAVFRRRLSMSKLWHVLLETGNTTVSVMFLILAANVFGRMLALSGFPQQVGGFIAAADIGLLGFTILFVLVVVVLGMFLDAISIMLILLPIVLPIVQSLGGDLVWFGIITVISVEMGLLTPPLGIAVYVVKSTITDGSASLNDIFLGALPFVIIMFVVTLILIGVPSLSLVFL